eukprot:5646094-Amphidinium_carterae.1
MVTSTHTCKTKTAPRKAAQPIQKGLEAAAKCCKNRVCCAGFRGITSESDFAAGKDVVMLKQLTPNGLDASTQATLNDVYGC